jgi:hypothetical protein
MSCAGREACTAHLCAAGQHCEALARGQIPDTGALVMGGCQHHAAVSAHCAGFWALTVSCKARQAALKGMCSAREVTSHFPAPRCLIPNTALIAECPELDVHVTAWRGLMQKRRPPTSTWRQVPVSRSHTRAVQSLDSVTARRPSRLTRAALTPPLCTRLASRSPRFCSAHFNCTQHRDASRMRNSHKSPHATSSAHPAAGKYGPFMRILSRLRTPADIM